jgi:hypothetical protein
MRRKTELSAVLLVLLLVVVGVGFSLLREPPVAAQEIGRGPLIVVFWEENFKGRSLEVHDTIFDMPVVTDEYKNEFNWSDEVRSILVLRGTWRIYQHGRCNTKLDETKAKDLDVKTKERIPGWSTLVSATSAGPLELSSPASGCFYHDISSIELVSEKNLPDWAAP